MADAEVAGFDKSWIPTRKWMAGVVTAVAAWIVNWIVAAEFNTEIQIALVGVVSTAVVAYLVPNQMTPGGYSEGNS